MNKENKYLFFSDLDDTLLTSEKTISEATYKALTAFVEHGNRFVIATGRSLFSAFVVQKKLKLKFPGSYIVSFNGCQIYDCEAEKTLFKASLPLLVVRDIFDIAKRHGVFAQTYHDENIIAPRECEELKRYRLVAGMSFVLNGDPVSVLPEPPCKMLCIEFNDHEKQEGFRAEIMAKYKDVIETFYSTPYYLEIVPKGCHKGMAVRKLAEILGVPIECTIAAGDEENDITMIEAAGVGIAMINGNEKVKKVADIITEKDNDHDGLAEYFYRYGT